jgi:hypothetical protein
MLGEREKDLKTYKCFNYENNNKMKSQIQIKLQSQHLSNAAARFRLRNRKGLNHFEDFESLADARQYLLDLSNDIEDSELGKDFLTYDSVTAFIVTDKEEML